MDRILKNGELRVGTTATQPPMIATTKKGDIIGLDADIARLMADGLGVKVKFIKMSFSKLLPALRDGKVDIILSGMTMTSGRNTKVAFVGPYYVSGKGILAVAEKYAAIREAKGLDAPEVTVAALKNSTSQKFAETLMPKAKLIATGSYDEAIDLLFNNKVDVLVADFPFCALTAYRHREKGLAAGKSPLTFEPLGIAMPEDALLINWVHNFMITLKGSGELEKLYKKWLDGGPWIKELP
jgi:polar amino acid transport system substrate-binding protein